MLNFIDVSYAQKTINWNEVKESKRVDGAYARATYGTNPVDDDGYLFQRNHDECKRLEIPVGGFHFFLFGQDGKDQAEHFLQQIDGRYGNVLPMVDVEEGSGSTGDVQENIKQLDAFNQEVKRVVKCPRIFIYCNQDTWNSTMGGTDAFSGQPLWVSNFYADTPAMPNGWAKYDMWQYATAKDMPGIIGDVDLDRLVVPLSEILL